MANDPWAGISSIGAIDQKLYQQHEPEPVSPTPTDTKQEDTTSVKPRKKVAKVETPERAIVQPQDRPYERRTFDFYQDQIVYLKQTSLQEKLSGNDLGMNAIIREAVDEWIKKRKSQK